MRFKERKTWYKLRWGFLFISFYFLFFVTPRSLPHFWFPLLSHAGSMPLTVTEWSQPCSVFSVRSKRRQVSFDLAHFFPPSFYSVTPHNLKPQFGGAPSRLPSNNGFPCIRATSFLASPNSQMIERRLYFVWSLRCRFSVGLGGIIFPRTLTTAHLRTAITT